MGGDVIDRTAEVEAMVLAISERNHTPIGIWHATVYDGDKEWNEHGRLITPVLWQSPLHRNRIVTAGKQLILDRLNPNASVLTPNGITLGTSATGDANADTTITNGVFKAFNSGAAGASRSGLVNTYVSSYGTADANINIQEGGMQTQSGGTLFNRVAPFLSFTKTTAMALDVTCTLSQG